MKAYNDIVIIGFSGHAMVIVDAIFSRGGTVPGYFDREEKYNSFGIPYLGLKIK